MVDLHFVFNYKSRGNLYKNQQSTIGKPIFQNTNQIKTKPNSAQSKQLRREREREKLPQFQSEPVGRGPVWCEIEKASQRIFDRISQIGVKGIGSGFGWLKKIYWGRERERDVCVYILPRWRFEILCFLACCWICESETSPFLSSLVAFPTVFASFFFFLL